MKAIGTSFALRSVPRAVGFATALVLGAAIPVSAQVARCTPDMTRAGSFCIDRYEASVWSIPASAKSLIKKVQKGKAKLSDLTGGGATELGATGDNYAPCNDNGTGCDNVYAVSIAGILPSANITWLQAQQACANSLKRLPSNAEWQQAANGTQDPGPDNGTTDCNTNSTQAVANTGSRSGCVSRFGAYDMVGNLYEWVADLVPASTSCPYWGAFSDDVMCLSGASTTRNSPGAVYRGGTYASGKFAGPLDISAIGSINDAAPEFGFRCAR